MTKSGHILRIPDTHAESIQELPTFIFDLFNGTPSRTEGGVLARDHLIREAFINESGWLRFRVHQSRGDHGKSFTLLIDITQPKEPTPGQKRRLDAIKSMKNITINEYTMDETGVVSIANKEQTPFRQMLATVEASSISEGLSQASLFGATDPNVRRMLKMRRTGD